MKRIFAIGLAAAALAAVVSLVAQTPVPEIAFDSNADLLKLQPATGFLGEVAGVATNSKGNIFVYTRTGHPYATIGDSRTFYHAGSRLFEFSSNGNFVKELGQDLYGFNAAQGLRVDPQDNVWAVDIGSNQIIKFDTNGAVQLVLGRKPETIGVRPAAARGAAPVEAGPAPAVPAAPGAGRGGRGGAPAPAAAAPAAAPQAPAHRTVSQVRCSPASLRYREVPASTSKCRMERSARPSSTSVTFTRLRQ